MSEWLSDLELLVLLVACFSHDLDHRGTNNSFQAKYAIDPLKSLLMPLEIFIKAVSYAVFDMINALLMPIV